MWPLVISPVQEAESSCPHPQPARERARRPAQHLNAKVVGISLAAAVGGFLFGFDTSVINGAVNALSEEFSLGPG